MNWRSVPLAVVAALAIVRAQETTRLPSIELLGSMRTIPTTWPVGALSPDGTWLAYAVRNADAISLDTGGGYTATGMNAMFSSHGTDLWLADTRSGQSVRIYSTIAVITQTQRIKGAAMGTGQADLLAHYLEFNREAAATASRGRRVARA